MYTHGTSMPGRHKRTRFAEEDWGAFLDECFIYGMARLRIGSTTSETRSSSVSISTRPGICVWEPAVCGNGPRHLRPCVTGLPAVFVPGMRTAWVRLTRPESVSMCDDRLSASRRTPVLDSHRPELRTMPSRARIDAMNRTDRRTMRELICIREVHKDAMPVAGA